jgi:hypothetical protein
MRRRPLLPNTAASPDGAGSRRAANEQNTRVRYGVVFLLAVAIVIFFIAAPSANWSRAVALALQFAALLVVIETSSVRRETRRRRAAVVGGAAAVIVILAGAGVVPPGVTFGFGGILSLIIPAALLRGLIRLFRTQGVTPQGVAGALAIYLMVGLAFSSVIGLTAELASQPYFASGTDGTQGERVYYSFTVLTTTGFGDFTAGMPVGRAIAVVEMLTGQLYLVTVIGLLIGHIASGRREGGAEM